MEKTKKVKVLLPLLFITLFVIHHIVSYYPITSFNIFNNELQRILDKNKLVFYVTEINRKGKWCYVSSKGGKAYRGFPFLIKYDILPARFKWKTGIYIIYLRNKKRLSFPQIFRIPFKRLFKRKTIYNVIKNNLPDTCYFIISVYGNLDNERLRNFIDNLEYINIKLSHVLNKGMSIIILNKKIGDNTLKIKEYSSKDKVILLKIKI